MMLLNYQIYDNDIVYAGGRIDGLEKRHKCKTQTVTIYLSNNKYPVVMKQLHGERYVITKFCDSSDFELFMSDFYRAITEDNLYNEYLVRRRFKQYAVVLVQLIASFTLICSLIHLFKGIFFPDVITAIMSLLLILLMSVLYKYIRNADFSSFKSWLYNADGTLKEEKK